MVEENSQIPTPTFDSLPKDQRDLINNIVIEKTRELMNAGKLAGSAEDIDRQMHIEIERIAIKLKNREEELGKKFSNLTEEQIKELVRPNKSITGGDNAVSPRAPCHNLRSLECDTDNLGYTKG